jgi:hypothetical protein
MAKSNIYMQKQNKQIKENKQKDRQNVCPHPQT